jgi:hypothetical protein
MTKPIAEMLYRNNRTQEVRPKSYKKRMSHGVRAVPSHGVDRMKRRCPRHRVGGGWVAELRVLKGWRLPWAVSYGSSKEYSGEQELESMHSMAVGWGALHELLSLHTNADVACRFRRWLRSQRQMG